MGKLALTPMGGRRALPVLAAMVLLLAAVGCADRSIDREANAKRLAADEVTLKPEEARAMINAYRARRGLKPLRLNGKLALAAKRHSDDLAKHDQISHKGTDGSDPWDRVNGTGYKAGLAAENVGAGQMSLAEVFKDWQESPEHDENLLLPDATQMGIALAIAPQTRHQTFWTLVLGAPR